MLATTVHLLTIFSPLITYTLRSSMICYAQNRGSRSLARSRALCLSLKAWSTLVTDMRRTREETLRQRAQKTEIIFARTFGRTLSADHLLPLDPLSSPNLGNSGSSGN